MRKLALLVPFVIVAAGCSGGAGDAGNVATAEAASAKTPKSPDQLPASMPPEARRSAEGAMMASDAMKSQQEAQMDGMKKYMQSRGGN